MAELAGVLLSPFFQVFFERMESGEFVDFFREQKLIEGLLQKLKIELLSVNALLEDAVKKQLRNPAVKEWLHKLKDAVYDAEDILYEIATEALRPYDAEAILSRALHRKSLAAKEMKDCGDPTGFTIEIEPALISTELEDIAKWHGIVIVPRKLDTKFQTTASEVRIGSDDDVETNYLAFDMQKYIADDDVETNYLAFDMQKYIADDDVETNYLAFDMQKYNARENAKQNDEVRDMQKYIARENARQNARQNDEVRDILKYIARKEDRLSRQKDELDIVLDELECLARQKDVLDLKEGVGGESLETLPMTSLDEESGIFGRDDDKEKIINLLLSTDASRTKNMRVIVIVGMVGIGKTTLAQLVYNDQRVESHFELKAWVCVSPEFDKLRVTKTILEAVTSLTCDIGFLTGLQLALKEKLMGKKFLLVLDDVWNENYADWKMLSNPFEFGAPGSMVIVTTRNHRVASIMRASETYYLKELQDENCWSLFARYAFQGNSYRCEAREVLGKQIIKKCKGHPLAAKTIGALLQSKVDVAEWEKVNSELSDLSNVEETILPTLMLSYKDLPLHLKRCFAYCSIFPTNYVFEKRQLILLWMAEGLLPPSENKYETVEKVGDDYFRALESRSLFQQSSGDKSHFVMHAFVNDLASFASWQFNFRLEADNCHPIGNKTRHFSYLSTRFDKFEKFEALYQANWLRTFLPLNTFPWGNCLAKEVLNNLLPELRCLRVLSLAHYDNVTELPESIEKIKHLHYLNLSFTRIKRLPDSICKLWNLQTLNLSGCQDLDVLPKDMCELFNLRHLDITRTAIKKMPIQLGSLKYLQTLFGFIISKPIRACMEELGKLSNLRGSLSIFELQNLESLEGAMDVNLGDLKYLEELVLNWKVDTIASESHITVFDSILRWSNLKSFTINGYGSKSFPAWRSFLKLISLRLENCKFCLCLPKLGELPSLQDLSIFGFEAVVKVDIEFYGNSYSPFRALKILRFEQMLNWEKWSSIVAKSFPQLEELYILKCPKLIGGSPIHLPSLAKLEINECPKLLASLSNAPKVREMRLTHCNDALLNDLPTGMQIFVVAGFNALRSLPEGIMDSNSLLQELRIYSCSSLMKLSTVGLPSTLKILEVTFCEKLELPMCTNYPSLERLLLTYSCDSLRSIQLELFPKLYEIKICGCRNLESLTAPRQYESDLVTLEIRDCPYFVSFPEGGLRAPKLTSICIINCGSLRSLPDKMQILLPSLQKLHIEDCPEVEPFLEGAMPSYLKSISIDGCDKPEDEKSFPKA